MKNSFLSWISIFIFALLFLVLEILVVSQSFFSKTLGRISRQGGIGDFGGRFNPNG